MTKVNVTTLSLRASELGSDNLQWDTRRLIRRLIRKGSNICPISFVDTYMMKN